MVKAYLCHNQTFTEMKKIFSILAVALAFVAAFSSCKKEDEEEKITNTITIRGATLNIRMALYAKYDDFYNFDLDAGEEDSNLHGYGGFEASMVGKTTDLKGQFFMSFNPMSGNSIVPQIKSGTVKITEVEKGLHIVVDAVEESGDKFKINVLAEDEFKKVWD